MPAKDAHHDAIKRALIKEGWIILDDPYTIKYKQLRVFADLRAGGLVAAERGHQQIVVEIKSFQGFSPMREFETALGQLTVYRVFLKRRKLDLKVYLGIGKEIHQDFFQQPAIQAVLDEVGVPLIVVDLETETIIRWID